MKPIAATVGAGGRRDFFWLDRDFAMLASSPVRGLGFNLRLGGIFTSVPVAIASMVRRDFVISGGMLTAERVAAEPVVSSGSDRGPPLGSHELPEATAHVRRDLGEVVGGLQSLTQCIDLFGLGLDYAMYHKRLWGTFDQDDLSPWHRLDGVFTSTPSAISWGNRIDIFGVGMDHAMYVKRCIGESWTPEWLRLGGAFTSGASLVSRAPNRLDLFARGSDFTLRGNQTDGTTWFGWQNHGGALASAPVTASWGPDRLDVFAVFKDGALWHRWWDGQLWNEWESLGGKYAGEPAVTSWGAGRLDVFVRGAERGELHHHRFSNDTWSVPVTIGIGSQAGLGEAPTAISTAPNTLEVFVPTNDNQILILKGDGQSWQAGAAGATFRAPGRYRLSVERVKVDSTRALDADTAAAMASIAVGNAGPRTKTQWIGKLGGIGNPKTSETNRLNFEPVTVELAEPMSFSYLVVNNGHAPQDKILAALANAGDSLGLEGSSSMQEDIAKGIVKIVSVKIAAAIAIYVPVIGSALGAIETWLMGKLADAAFKSCDGVVAVELRAMLGRDLLLLTDNGRKTITMPTQHSGTDSPAACGDNSDYEVTWSIRPL